MKKLFLLLLATVWICGAAPVLAQSFDPGTGVKLTSDKMYFPVWSPDGKWIASCGGFDGVWIVPAGGGNPIQLRGQPSSTNNGKTFYFMVTRKMGFTPDSKEVVYTSFLIDESRGSSAFLWKPASGNEVLNEIPVLMAVNIETRETRVIREEAEYGQYSKSGRYFAYVNYDHRAVTDPDNAEHHYALAVEDTQTGETRYYMDTPGLRTRSFSFSADESYIAAEVIDTNAETYSYTIYRIPLDGGSPVDISWRDNPWELVVFTNPDCSPDGRWIMYSAVSASNSRRILVAYDTSNGTSKLVFPESTVWNTDGVWSPDGKKFCCQLELGSTHKGALYMYDFVEENLGVRPEIADVPLYIPWEYGKKLVDFDLNSISREDSALYLDYMQLTSGYELSPVWSPDGGSIAFTTKGFRSCIWSAPVDGGTPSLEVDFTNAYEHNGYNITLDSPSRIQYSPDGLHILFGSYIIDESRGTVVTITEGTTPGGGTYFGCSIKNAINALKTFDLETGEIQVVLDSSSLGNYSRTGRYIAYTTFPGKALMLHDTSTGETRELMSNSGGPHCFAPDDSYLLAGGSTSGLVRVPLDGGPAETLLSETCYSADISPDGRLALCSGTCDGRKGIFVYDFESGNSYPLIMDRDGFTCRFAAFSPNGAKFCYTLSYSGNDSWSLTYVRGFNTMEIGIPTTVEEQMPVKFALTGNYPNPFNPSTSLGFSLDTPGKVHLAVYSITGQKVRELIPGALMQPGVHTVIWDGRDESGNAVSSGVYIALLQQGTRVLSRKMMLMK